MSNKMFLFKVQFTRKSSLKIYQVYSNVVNFGLDRAK